MDDAKFKIEVDGEVKEAEMLKTVSLDGNNYAIYAIDKGDETSDILASRIIKDDEGKDTLVDLETGRNLYSLYYESESVEKFNVSQEGFVIKGEDSAKFLEEKLEILGFTNF